MMMNQNGFNAGMMGGGGNDSLNASNNSSTANANGIISNANSVAALLRNGPGGNPVAMQGMMAGMVGGNMGGVGGATSGLPNMGNMMAAMGSGGGNFQTNNPMMNMANMTNMNNFNFDQFKRLQQMAQLQQQASMMPHSAQQDPSTALLQTYLDQKIQTSRFGELGGMSAGMAGLQGMQGQNPMAANLLMMNPSGLGGVGGNLNAVGGGNEIPLPSPHSLFHRDGSRRMRGGVIEPFPEKLHRLLLEVEAAGRADVISFVAGGRAFAIHKPEKFFKEIVPLYFRQSRLSSFKRQLNLYGFELINTGPARGGYYHELFVKDRPEFCRRMRRVAVKVTPKNSDPSEVSKDKEPALKKPKVEAKSEVTKEKDGNKTVDDVEKAAADEEPEADVGGGLSDEVKTSEILA